MLASGIVYLKVLGMSIAGVIGIVLLLMCTILVIPICYTIRWKYHNRMEFQMKCKWLCSIFSCSFVYKGVWVIVVKVFGIPLYRSDKVKKEKKTFRNIARKKRTEKKKKVKKELIEKPMLAAKKEEIPHKIEKIDYNKEQENLLEGNVEEQVNSITTLQEEYATKNIVQKVISACQRKIERVIMKYKMLWKRVLETIEMLKEVVNSIKAIRWNITYYKKIWQTEEMKVVLQLISNQLSYLHKVLKPRKISGVIEFGTGDPAETGELLAYGSIIAPLLGRNVQLIPYFDDTIFRGSMVASGKIRMIQLLKILVIFFRSKELKQVIMMWNNKESSNGRT